ncbi:helix-turn-helix domain-containing protein [Frankia sp. QA3]|uniref:helix-turn-helix domain-containing protein n=1 Tax=Frankia sp. QA3 TaxID=710111 RepID=UPI000269C5F7|nr:helix-turn-helix domain-containing protein [Frankia sp. QA3]EIV93983.1 DNA-binding domain-containing protein, AraC-type [Frankia sp. QA3]
MCWPAHRSWTRIAVPADLRETVQAFWYAHVPVGDGWEAKLPGGSFQLVVNLDRDRFTARDGSGGGRFAAGGAALAGALALPVLLDRSERRRVFGISLRPAAGGVIAGGACPQAAAVPLIDLGEVWGTEGRLLRERLLALPGPAEVADHVAQVLRHRGRAHLDPAAIALAARAAGRLGRGMRVTAVADSLGVSTSTLTRLLRRELGLTPKVHQRVARFQRVLTTVGAGPDTGRAVGSDWAAIAAACGYYDQSHLIHEFTALAGMRPGHYLPNHADGPHHAALPKDAARVARA